MIGANAPAALASRPIRIVLCDEVDRYPASAGTEGDPVNLARKRTITFRSRKRVALFSTPTIKGKSRIERAWKRSDQRRYYVPCPHCGDAHVLRWENISIIDDEHSTARMSCPTCGGLIVEWTHEFHLGESAWPYPDESGLTVMLGMYPETGAGNEAGYWPIGSEPPADWGEQKP